MPERKPWLVLQNDENGVVMMLDEKEWAVYNESRVAPGHPIGPMQLPPARVLARRLHSIRDSIETMELEAEWPWTEKFRQLDEALESFGRLVRSQPMSYWRLPSDTPEHPCPCLLVRRQKPLGTLAYVGAQWTGSLFIIAGSNERVHVADTSVLTWMELPAPSQAAQQAAHDAEKAIIRTPPCEEAACVYPGACSEAGRCRFAGRPGHRNKGEAP